jgi:hypothetical protein
VEWLPGNPWEFLFGEAADQIAFVFGVLVSGLVAVLRTVKAGKRPARHDRRLTFLCPFFSLDYHFRKTKPGKKQ